MVSDKSTAGALKARILFVEDEATLREHLAQVLSDDYQVDTAGNGAEALRAILRAKPDLVVTDRDARHGGHRAPADST